MSLEKIYDAIHGFIHFNEWERELIDSRLFQRLHYLHQLGICYLVYPGATHTRFGHSLGTMELASRIFNQITKKADYQEPDKEYWRQLVRFAALCHDLGHLPFSHVAEKRLLSKKGHEYWTLKIIQSNELAPLWQKMEKRFQTGRVLSDLLKLSLGEEKSHELGLGLSFNAWERVFSQIVSGDFVGADRIDYLLRDAKSTGLSYGLFDYSQLIEMLCVVNSEKIGIEENGLESCEALLLARHYMYRRLYQYPPVKAYSFHLARLMQHLYQSPHYFQDLNGYLSMSEAEVLLHVHQAAEEPSHPHYLDASCISSRKKRFKAIAIPNMMPEIELQEFKKNYSIPDHYMEWEPSHKKPNSGLSLSVLRKNGHVVPATELSEITIPSSTQRFVYIAPEYAQTFVQSLSLEKIPAKL
ncbi:MAG TPA: HD domain-containing protein [Rhabdochlamydiaceae bacterium]|nr:HD domain-containing protein [Rhabdochlamydiaceae bacterium]